MTFIKTQSAMYDVVRSGSASETHAGRIVQFKNEYKFFPSTASCDAGFSAFEMNEIVVKLRRLNTADMS